MQGNFNLPCVDHLVEGVDYKVVTWDFADEAPACPPGEKMIFGVCRKLKPDGAKDEKDFDSEKRSKQEEDLEGEVKKQGIKATTKEEAIAANQKGFTSGGKRYGWAIKNGKPVIVEWGSVAKEKKVGPAAPKPAASAGGAAAAPKPAQPAAAAAQRPATQPPAPKPAQAPAPKPTLAQYLDKRREESKPAGFV